MIPAFQAGHATRLARRLPLLAVLLAIGPAAGRQVQVRTVAELTRAVSAARAGDTLLLEEGTYALDRFIQLDGKQDLTLASRTGQAARTLLRGKGFASRDGADDILRIGSSKRIVIENLGFEECHSYGIKLEAEKNPEDIHIRGCRFRQIGTRHIKGSMVQGTRALRGSITGCHFQNTSVPGADWNAGGNYIAAIDLMALDGWRIAGNTIRNVKGLTGQGRAAIFVWVGSRNVTVEGNAIIGCDRGIALGNPSPSTNGAALHVENSACRNNFIVAGPDAGIELAWVRGVQVAHNTVWRPDADGRGIRSIENVESTVIANNLVRGRILLTGTEAAAGNLSGSLDGYFGNPQAGDLHLTLSASGAVDRATALAGIAVDIDGDRRPQGSAADIGADERAPGGTVGAAAPGAPAPDTAVTPVGTDRKAGARTWKHRDAAGRLR